MENEIEQIKEWFEGLKTQETSLTDTIDQIISKIGDKGFSTDDFITDIKTQIKNIGSTNVQDSGN